MFKQHLVAKERDSAPGKIKDSRDLVGLLISDVDILLICFKKLGNYWKNGKRKESSSVQPM